MHHNTLKTDPSACLPNVLMLPSLCLSMRFPTGHESPVIVNMGRDIRSTFSRPNVTSHIWNGSAASEETEEAGCS